MYFTLLFRKYPEGAHLAYDMAYHPDAVWCKDGELLGIPTYGQHYKIGYLEKLLNYEHERHFQILLSYGPKEKVTIICHNEGHGGQQCLQNIIEDLKNHGFSSEVLSKPNNV